MKTKFTKKGRRILSAALCLLMMITALPMSAFAWTSEEGKSCTSSFGDYYVGSDGEYYRSKATYSFIVYDSKGNITVQSINAGNAKRKYLMTDNSGTHQVYCVESGVDFNTGNSYVSKSGKNSSYFQNLPTDAQFGIMMALMYGWHEGKSSPVAGTNVDDYAFATQTIIWEYQQQLRTSPSNRQSANGIDGDTYYYSLKGRPAEKCYNWILSQMSKHYTIPSFAARSQSNADTYTLKYNPDTKKYSLTLEDTNNTLSDIKFSASGISVTRSGNKYTFTSDKMITSPVTVSAQKNVNLDCGEMLIWGCVGKQTMVSGASDPVYFYLKIDTETYGTGQIKKTSEDGVVSGISFNISGNGVNKTVTTGADGTVDVQLMPGVYTVTEQSIDRYEPQSVQRVTIVSGHTATVTFNNTLKRGSLEIIKNSEDNLVEGVKFHLYGTSLSGLPVDEYAVTDENGVARFENVLISGETPYTVEEVDTAIRYVVPESQTAPIEWEKVTSRSFTNILKKFNVTVTKSDAETGTAQGDASLAGAVYGIYKGEELIDTYTTDENGQFTTDYYICDDDWTIREISPSEGYLLDTTIHHIGAEPELYTVERNSTANDVTEQIIKGNIAIIKHTDDGETQIETPETGATFEVYLKAAGSYDAAKETERDILTCDENGFAQTKDMPYGVYVVEQTSGWEGRELMKPFEVFISKDGQTYRYLINNANFESYIKIVKKDAETGATIPYAGAGFQIYDPNGELVTMTFTYPEVTTIDTFYTTADGYLITPQTLEYGTGYSIVEVQAPYGYVLNSEPVYFDVTQDGSAEESGITVIEVVRSNMAQKGTITVSKSGEVFTSVSENNGMYQPVFAVQRLEGAVYEITAAEDIYTLDGTLRASKGEVVDTITTGTDGIAKSKELYLGKYEVKEITAPYGMVLNDEIHAVELVYAGQNIAVTETETSFYNERQRVEIDLVKSLETDEAYGVGNNGEIFDVTFGLYAETDLTAADGTVIPADGLIEIISLDENGKGTVNSDLPFGSYYVKELSTNSAYVLNEQKYSVHFEYAGQDTAVVHLSANDGETIENEIIYGSVSGMKSDEDGNALGGAVIGIFKTGTEEFTKENAIQTTTSADDGSFSFEKVPYGTWVIREIESPTGFVLSEEEIAVTVGKVDEVVEIELVNYFIKGNIELTKVDADYPDNKLTGAVFEVYADTNGNGEFDKDDELCGEMTELEGGVYQMTELRYGKYFVREKTAPDGFVLDDGVYGVSIEENGKTYARLHYLLKDDLMKMEAITQETRLLCRNRIDTVEQLLSYNCYNPFVYLRNDNDVQRLVTNLFKATTPKGSQSQDPFWDTAASMLLLALVFYLKYEAPPDEQNFPMVMELLRAGEVREDDDSYVSPLDELFDRLELVNPEHIALKYYRDYHSGSAKTLKSIQITLAARLEKFNLESLAGLTATDELDLPSLGEKKVALFALIPDNDTSFNFLVSILYTQLFQQLFYLADHKYGGSLPVHCHFIMDEFANVSLPDDFDKILSVMRSRGVSVSIILQNLAQLKALFEKQWESIVGNCDTFLYLGGNEQSTHKYVSELLGKETIDTNTYGKSEGRSGSYSTNYQISGRELMTPDEVRMLDNRYALLFVRGERPVMDFKYDIMKHPNVRLTTDGGKPPYIHGEPTQAVATLVFDSDIPKNAVSVKAVSTSYELLSNEDLEEIFNI